MKTHKSGIFSEYLGDIATEALFQNINNDNPHVSSIGWLRESVPQGFSVTVEMEKPIYETEEEKRSLPEEMNHRMEQYVASGDPDDLQPKGKLIRIVLEVRR